MKVFAVDPGFGRIGFALVEKAIPKNNVIFSECFVTPTNKSQSQRIAMVGDRFEQLLDRFKPKIVVLEKLFFSKNKKTAMRVAEVRGMLIAQTIQRGLELQEYTPAQVKLAVAGSGNADKKQMMKMIPHIVIINPDKKMLDDEYDAIAIGVTCIQHNSYKKFLGDNVLSA